MFQRITCNFLNVVLLGTAAVHPPGGEQTASAGMAFRARDKPSHQMGD